MIPRLITACIFIFCGIMTAKLVHSILYPEGSDLAKVPPRIIFDHFVDRTDGSDLDIWEGNKIIGSCKIDPHPPVMHAKDGSGTASVKVDLTVLIRLPQPMLNSKTIKLAGDMVLHSNGNLDNLDLELSLPGSIPRVALLIVQPSGQASPFLTLKRGANEILFSNAPGAKQDGPMAFMVEAMLKSSGLSMDTLSQTIEQKKAEQSPDPIARTGLFYAGGKRFSGYLLTNGAAAENAGFALFMEDTGEIMRIDTPLTGEGQLGLRCLTESRRPPGVEKPDLDEYHFLDRILKGAKGK